MPSVVRKAVRKSSKKRRTPRARRRRAPNRAALKRRVLSTIRGTGDKPWTVDDLMPKVGCSDRELLLQCCDELVEDGSIHSSDRPAAEGLPAGDSSENLPEHMAFDLQPPEAIGLSSAARQVVDRAVMGEVMVAKPVAESHMGLTDERRMELLGNIAQQPPSEKRIRQFALRKFGDWEKKKISATKIRNAAGNDLEYMREAGVLESESTFNRALGHQQRYGRRRPRLTMD
jgi:hypothetical protein